MNEISTLTAFILGLCVYFVILSVLILKHYFDKYDL